MLRFLVALLRARGAVPPLEDCPEGAPLVSAWRLEAVSADDSVPAAVSSPRIGTWGAGVSSPDAGGDDSRSAPSRDECAEDSATTLVSSGTAGSPSSSSHR